MTFKLSENECLVRQSRADRLRLAGRLFHDCRVPLLSAVLAASFAWGALVPALWSLLGLRLEALAGHGQAVAVLGSVQALVLRLALFWLAAGALASFLLLSLNNLIAHGLDGDTPKSWEEAVLILRAPWSRKNRRELAVWLFLYAAWGAASALASLAPYLGLALALAGTLIFALLHNCAMWGLVYAEDEGLWTALSLPFRAAVYSRVLWRKTLALGLMLCFPGLAVMTAALTPLWTGFFLSGLVFLLGAALLATALAFFSCYFALVYRQALANHRQRLIKR